MCVILDIQPGRTVPRDMLDITCKINAHGYGISWLENGRIKTKRSIEKNKPEEIEEVLQSKIKHRRFIHLRHATVGEVSLENNHPYDIMSKKNKDPVDLQMMHNGTFYHSEYTPTKDMGGISDSRLFANKLVKPFLRRCASYDRKKFLIDPFNQKFIEKDVPIFSVIVFFDSQGNVWKIHEDKGKDYPELGFWASNTDWNDEKHTRLRSPTSLDTNKSYATGIWHKGTFIRYDANVSREWKQGFEWSREIGCYLRKGYSPSSQPRASGVLPPLAHEPWEQDVRGSLGENIKRDSGWRPNQGESFIDHETGEVIEFPTGGRPTGKINEQTSMFGGAQVGPGPSGGVQSSSDANGSPTPSFRDLIKNIADEDLRGDEYHNLFLAVQEATKTCPVGERISMVADKSALGEKRLSFTEQSGLELKDFTMISESDFATLNEEFPKEMAHLFLEVFQKVGKHL